MDNQRQIDALSQKIRQAFGSLPKEALYAKPNPDAWSIAENLQHLITVNSSYFPLFQQLLDKTYRPAWSGKFKFVYKAFGKTILKSVSEGRKKKIKTFKTWEPQLSDSSTDILEKFEAHQEELKLWLEKLQPFLGKETVINSPVNKIISYTLDTAIEIIIAHEERHYQQALEVKQALKA